MTNQTTSRPASKLARRPPLGARAAAGPLALLLMLAAAPQARATTASELCTGNPCLIGPVDGAVTTVKIDPGSDIDFGPNTDVVLRTGTRLRVQDPEVFPRPVALRARSITLQSNARIIDIGDDGDITLEATGGNIELLGSGAGAARVEMVAPVGGTLTLYATGNVVLNGPIDVSGENIESTGGAIAIEAGGSITTTADLNAGANGKDSTGGEISLSAGTGISLGGIVDVSAAADAGAIFLSTTIGPITAAKKIGASGGNPEGYAGQIDIETGFGDVEINGTIIATGGSGIDFACGDGGELSITARNIRLDSNITFAGGRECIGGTIDLIADGSVTQTGNAPIRLDAPGTDGSGGLLTIDAFGPVTLTNVDLEASFGGAADVQSRSGLVTVNGKVTASGTGMFSLPGSIGIRGCTIRATQNGRLEALGEFEFDEVGIIRLQAHGASTTDAIVIEPVASLRAKSANEFVVRSGAPDIDGIVDPAATITLDPTLAACAAAAVCGNGALEPGELCDDGPENGSVASCCATGCASAKANGAACDDGLFCNGADTCVAAVCATHAGDPCTGATGPCQTTTCSESLHCAKPELSACDDADGNPCTDGTCSAGTCVPVGNDAASCDDGTFCNGAESCTGGTCRRTQIECAAESCDEGGGACESFCGDGVADDGESCGEPGTASCPTGQSCVDCACVAGGAPGDSYLCHDAAEAEAPAFDFVPATKSIRDRFETKSFDVTAVDRLCSPAVLGAPDGVHPPSDPSVAHVDHKIVQSSTPAPQAPFVSSEHAYADLFGTLQLVLRKPAAVFLRAKQSDFGPIVECAGDEACSDGDTCQSGACLPNPAEAPANAPKKNSPVSNYKCYLVKVKAGTPKFTKVEQLRVTDRLGTTLLLDATKPSRVCSPASIDGVNAAAANRPGQLTCYKVKLSTTDPKQATAPPHTLGLAYVGFGAAFVDTAKPAELCVPSLLVN